MEVPSAERMGLFRKKSCLCQFLHFFHTDLNILKLSRGIQVRALQTRFVCQFRSCTNIWVLSTPH